MKPDHQAYGLPISSESIRRTTAAWLLLGLAALVTAGVYSILLVLARTPMVQELTPFIDFFHIALVVHVNLSVLIWLLSMTGETLTAGTALSSRTMVRWITAARSMPGYAPVAPAIRMPL